MQTTPAHGDGLTVATTVLVAAIFAAASLLIWWMDAWFGAAMTRAPHMNTWLGLMVLQGAIAGAGLLPCWSIVVRLWKQTQHARLAIGWGLIGVVALLALPTFVLPRISPNLLGDNLPFLDHSLRMGAVTCLFGVSGIGAITAMWMLGATKIEDQAQPDIRRVAAELFEQKNIKRALLVFLGLQVGAITLTTGALRVALVEGGWVPRGRFPPEVVLVYGGYFVFVIVLVYLPSYLALQRRAERVRDALAATTLDPMDWLSQRSRLEEALGLKTTWSDTIKEGLPLLAPLIAAIVSILLEF
jgi:hypothetical protein